MGRLRVQKSAGFAKADSKGLMGRRWAWAAEWGGQGMRPISSAKKQSNITDAIQVVNGNQQCRTGNVRMEIFPTAKPLGIFAEESPWRRIVVSGAIVI